MRPTAPRPRIVLGKTAMGILLLAAFQVQAGEPAFRGDSKAPEEPLSLWYRRPAGGWLEALPLGNGQMGAMVFGSVLSERIQLNNDTLWSGGPKDCDNPAARRVLPEIRRLIAEGKYPEAHELGKKMMGPYTQTYLPMADLRLEFGRAGATAPVQIHDYRRTLDLDHGVARVSYGLDGAVYHRELFISHPDQVLVVRLTSSRPGSLTFTARLSSSLHFRTLAKENVLILRGKALRMSIRITMAIVIPSSTRPTSGAKG